jgi:plasmid stability protein
MSTSTVIALTSLVIHDVAMATVTIRNLPDDVHTALRVRAAQHGRSTEAEIREILAQSVCSEGRLKVGTELRRFGAALNGVELDVRRDREPLEPAAFE